MIKTLITGVTGLLGRTIVFENKEILDIIGGYYPEKKYETLNNLKNKYLLDIRDLKKIKEIVTNEKIEVIINCASLANVDYVETHKEEAYNTNYCGTKNIVDLCKEYKIKLVQISSNAVYDGNNPLYNENSKRNPINYYGNLKVMEEDYVMTNLENFVIIRPILMYGLNDSNERENPFTWQLRMQKANNEIKLVDDIFCNPLLSNDCAKIIIEIIKKNIKGIFNVAGGEILSRYEFGKKISENTGYDISKIIPVSNSFFKEIAPRPKDTSFDTKKIKEMFKLIPASIKEGILYLNTVC